MNKIIITSLVAIIVILCGCSEKGDPAVITLTGVSDGTFQNKMVFSSEEESKTIQFFTNKNWEILVSDSGTDVDWCSVTPKSGTAGDVTLTINVSKNATHDERSVILTLSAEEAIEKIRVSQKQTDAILLSSSLYEMPMEGGEIVLDVRSNVKYEVEIPKQFQDWIHNESGTRSLETKNLKFIVDGNLDYAKREGEIIISDGNITEVVKIYQSGGGILILSENEYNVSSAGGVVTIDLSSNFEYSFDLPNVGWIKLNNSSRSMSSHRICLDIMPNDDFENRSATIRFFDNAGSVSEDVIIKQAQNDALFVNTSSNKLSFKKQTFEIKVQTNVKFEVLIDSEWITRHETRGLNESSILLSIDENKTIDERSSKVTLRIDSLEKVIVFTQYGQPTDLSSKGTANSYIVPLKDAYFSIDASVAGNDKTHFLIGGKYADIVWYSSYPPIDNIEYENGRIVFRGGQSEGNVLIALRDVNHSIIWSWHLWLTDYDPDANYITFSDGKVLMDRYLGASSEEDIGLYYQWGRKDPFCPGYYHRIIPNSKTGSVEYSILHPDTFFSGSYDSTNWDWNIEHTATWSSEKTVFDPCPPGWKVMDGDCFPQDSKGYSVDEKNYCLILGEPICTPATKFRFTGQLHSSGYIQDVSFFIFMWTNLGTYHNFYSALEKGFNNQTSNNNPETYGLFDGYSGRAYGACIRCQRE